jgi:hypothetical protein
LYDVRMRRIRVTIVAVECVCILNHPARKVNAPYYHVACPAVQYFPTLSHKRHDFRKKKKQQVLSTIVLMLDVITSFNFLFFPNDGLKK